MEGELGEKSPATEEEQILAPPLAGGVGEGALIAKIASTKAMILSAIWRLESVIWE